MSPTNLTLVEILPCDKFSNDMRLEFLVETTSLVTKSQHNSLLHTFYSLNRSDDLDYDNLSCSEKPINLCFCDAHQSAFQVENSVPTHTHTYIESNYR